MPLVNTWGFLLTDTLVVLEQNKSKNTGFFSPRFKVEGFFVSKKC